MKIRWLLSAVTSLTACLAAAPVAGKFTPIAGFDQQIFPSYIIATAPMRQTDEAPDDHRLGDPHGVLGVEVVAPADNAPVTVTVQCDDCLEPSAFSVTLPKGGETYRVFPKVKYKYGRLARCTQAAPASMTFRVKLGEAPEEEETVTCTVRAVNDCPFALAEGDKVRDVSYTFAAYVNEQHPFVDKLLREALDRGVVDGFTGYQSGEPGEVMRQAYALWDLLVARDVRYSSITVSAVSSESVGSQHVRLIEDSVNNSQANCVDGSVLWASLMQRIGIDSFLVMESDHCYAGFFTDAKHDNCFAIETTMLGADIDAEELEVPEIIEEGVSEDLRDERSFASFVAAINYSTSRLAASLEKKSDDAVECQIIDVAQTRARGILPIAFQNGEEFVWYDDSEDWSDEEESDDEAEEAYASDAYESEGTDDDSEESDEEGEYSEDEGSEEEDSEDEGEWDEESSEEDDEEAAYDDED